MVCYFLFKRLIFNLNRAINFDDSCTDVGKEEGIITLLLYFAAVQNLNNSFTNLLLVAQQKQKREK